MLSHTLTRTDPSLTASEQQVRRLSLDTLTVASWRTPNSDDRLLSDETSFGGDGDAEEVPGRLEVSTQQPPLATTQVLSPTNYLHIAPQPLDLRMTGGSMKSQAGILIRSEAGWAATTEEIATEGPRAGVTAPSGGAGGWVQHAAANSLSLRASAF